MSRFDDAMREALGREEPPEGFAERLMARIDAGALPSPEAPERWWRRIPPGFGGPQLRWATALATVVLLVGGLEYRNQRLERAEGERVKEQVMLALRITGSKLRFAEAKVREFSTASVEH